MVSTAPIRPSYLRLFRLANAFKFKKTPMADAIELAVADLVKVRGELEGSPSRITASKGQLTIWIFCTKTGTWPF